MRDLILYVRWIFRGIIPTQKSCVHGFEIEDVVRLDDPKCKLCGRPLSELNKELGL